MTLIEEENVNFRRSCVVGLITTQKAQATHFAKRTYYDIFQGRPFFLGRRGRITFGKPLRNSSVGKSSHSHRNP